MLTYRSAGVQRSMTLGSFPDWTAKQARTEAMALKRRIDQGEDPMLDRHQERAAPTLGDLADHYRQTHLPRKRPSSGRNDELALRLHVLPRLSNRKLAAIQHSDIAALHRKVGETSPIAANRVVALLSKMFRHRHS